MYRKMLSLLFIFLLVTAGCAASNEGNSANVPSETGETVGSVSKKVVNATKEAAGEVKEGSKKAGKSIWGAMKDFGKGVKKGWKDVTSGDGPSSPTAPAEPEKDEEH